MECAKGIATKTCAGIRLASAGWLSLLLGLLIAVSPVMAAKPKSATKLKRSSGALLPLNLHGSAVGRWSLVRPMDELGQLRLELTLAPRGVPRWRFVGPAQLARDQPVTWLEFVQSKADTVLKWKLEAQIGDTIEVTATPHFQLLPNGPVQAWSEEAERRAQQMVVAAQWRVDNQLQWLAVRLGKARSASGASGGRGGGARGGAHGPPSGGPATTQLTAMQSVLQQQKVAIGQARQRLERLHALRDKLQSGVQLELRATRADTGEQLELQPLAEQGGDTRDAVGLLGTEEWPWCYDGAMNTTHPDRRQFLRFALGGGIGLTLPQLLQLRATHAAPRPEKTAIILVWLRGGCSHLDTYDPKPEASTEFRGPFTPLDTRVPGMLLTELLPRQAQLAHRFSLLRSIAHTGGGHPAGSLQLLAGDRDRADKLEPVLPDFMTIAHYLRKDSRRTLPNYVGVNPIKRYDNFTIAGPGYLGPSFEPFAVLGDPSLPQFEVPNIGLKDPALVERLNTRLGLRGQLDRLQRTLDARGVMESVDVFQQQAFALLTSPEARIAFDLNLEPDAVRDRYGRHAWGQQCLMARRLVEAGVEIVTTTFDGPLCGRVANWDDHAVNHHVFDALKFRAPYFDQAVSALIEDVYQRGLDRRVLVVVTGEFGRTPRISHVASSGGGVASAPAGTVQPGRDHWPNANTILWAGGGIRTGQVIGATDARGEEAVERRVGTHDFLATIYHHLGIDAARVAIPDFSGRPTPILADGQPIPELIAS